MHKAKDWKKQKNRQKRTKKNIIFLTFCFVCTLLYIGIFNVYKIKANYGDNFEKKAIQNQMNKVRDKMINPNRGSILDRNGQVMAISSTVYNVILDIRVMNEQNEKYNNLDKKLKKIADILKINQNELTVYFEKDKDGKLKPENDTNWKVIKKKVPFDMGKELEKAKITGVYIEADTLRNYPHDTLASQVIGFVRGDTSWGIEHTYDEKMTGTPGRIHRTYDGVDSIITTSIAPIKGNDIVTTIDLTLQQYAEQIVKDTYWSISPKHTPENVSLVLMNPNTGEILSMAQYPNFNLNNPEEISLLENDEYRAKFKKLNDKEKIKIQNSIWKNFNAVDTFEPGSTFKAVTVAAGIEEGVISKDETFFCEGYKMVAGHKIRCHKRSGHGKLTLTEALAKSCNVAMMDIAEKLGREKFYKYQKDFGFGEKTGIDILGEEDGLILPEKKLNATELATSSFGQTFSSTVIQDIVAFAAVINGGKIMQPYLLSQVLDKDGNVVKENIPNVVRKVISEDTSAFLREAMVNTLLEGGTGRKAKISGYDIGGKTGTAQQGVRSDNIYTLSFAAYLPAENPKYLAFATINKPKDYIKAPPGTVSPSPMIKEFMQKIIDYKAIPPSGPEEVITEDTNSDTVVLKDFTNKGIKEAITEINSIGIDFQIVGAKGDTVVQQIPPPNTRFDKNSKVLLYIEPKADEKNLVSVPDIKGLQLEEAKALLESIGFVINPIKETDVIGNIKENIQEKIEETTQKTEDEKDIGNLDELEDKKGNNEENNKKNNKENTPKTIIGQNPPSEIFIQKGATINAIYK